MEEIILKIKINQKFIKLELKRIDMSYSELAEITGGDINRWKHVFNKGGFIKDTELRKLVDILHCDQNLLIDPDFQIWQNVPLEIDIILRKLYERRKIDIQPDYESIMRNFLQTSNLENFLGEANRLLSVLFGGDSLTSNMIPALTIITNDFQKERNFSKSNAELDEKIITDIFSQIIESISCNSVQQAMVIFLYALILFDVVFLEESIASVAQFTRERFGNKADQYCRLTLKIEILRNTLINAVTKKDLQFEGVTVEEITDEILSGIQIMLLACYMASQHLHGDYLSSEYVNRTELDAIITHLTHIIVNLGIEVPEPFPGLSGTRFYKNLYFIRSLYRSRKPEKSKLLNWNDFAMGFITGSQFK